MYVKYELIFYKNNEKYNRIINIHNMSSKNINIK